MAELFDAGKELQKLKTSSFDDIQAGRIKMGLPPEGDFDQHSLFMNELRSLTGSQLRQMAAVPGKQISALGAAIVLNETPGKCIDMVLFSASGQVKIGDRDSNGVTLGVALDERNQLSPKCD